DRKRLVRRRLRRVHGPEERRFEQVREVHRRRQPAAGDPDDDLDLEAREPAGEAAADPVELAPRDVSQPCHGATIQADRADTVQPHGGPPPATCTKRVSVTSPKPPARLAATCPASRTSSSPLPSP